MTVNNNDYIQLREGKRFSELNGKRFREIKVAVYGGGSFVTAMACVLGRKGIRATLVVRKQEVVEQVRAPPHARAACPFLARTRLPSLMCATTRHSPPAQART
jgi:glycerol-3-phosphate dehydrogenase